MKIYICYTGEKNDFYNIEKIFIKKEEAEEFKKEYDEIQAVVLK